VIRRLFRDDPALCSRVVLSPSIVFVRFARGRRIGDGRWVECGEAESEGVVLVVHVEAEKMPEHLRGGAA
jgi:hypothetical protein